MHSGGGTILAADNIRGTEVLARQRRIPYQGSSRDLCASCSPMHHAVLAVARGLLTLSELIVGQLEVFQASLVHAGKYALLAGDYPRRGMDRRCTVRS